MNQKQGSARKGPMPTTWGSRNDPTAQRLVAAGRLLFAHKGFRGATIRAITKEAGANLGAVTYYFASKEALYHAVLEQCLRPLRDRVTEAAAVPGPPLDRIEGVVRGFFAHLRENPDMPRFMLREMVESTRPAAPVLATVQHVLTTFSILVREGQNAGGIRPGNPYLMAVSVVFQPVHLSVVAPMLPHLLGHPQGEAPDALDPEEHAVQFVRAGLGAGEEITA